MARSKWKNKFFSFDLWKKIIFIKQNLFKKVTKKDKHFRSSSIPLCFNLLKIGIHKGNIFKKLYITKHIVGYKFGEFSFTKKPFYYPKKIVVKVKKR